MELRLFNQSKDPRFVRPHRVALLEWLRALRHNMFCEGIHLIDETRGKLINLRTTLNERWMMFEWSSVGERIRQALNGRRAAELTKVSWEHLKTKGVGPSFWPLVFVIGLLIGIGAKTLAESSITIGHEDYKLTEATELYDLNALAQKHSNGLIPENPNPKKSYPACIIE